MNLDEIKRLIEFIREQELTEFELEQDGVKIRIKSGHVPPQAMPLMQAVPVLAAPALAAPPVLPAIAPPGAGAVADASAMPDEGTELAIVKSPIVGTFYRQSDPDAKSFVEIGDPVNTGKVLCIFDAMKLMNEIDSEYDGEIVSVYVENGQAVQYGERLFAIKLRV
jgi:acetyl-CoA carboxylase biotin carboxyl carrier protein